MKDHERAGWAVVAASSLGYVGVYLCRKNFSVAVPLLQEAFGATKAQVGAVATAGTIAYAAGKFINGPIVDRLGGRIGFLLAIIAVALFGAAGALAPGLGVLALFYGMNRYAGAGGWGAMLKLVPSWFPPARTGTVVGVLSMSYVGGGVLATLLAREVVALGGGWRAVMGVPSIFAIVIAGICAVFVRKGPIVSTGSRDGEVHEAPGRLEFLTLFRRPQFLITCALCFTVTLMREAFNTWSVDFLFTVQADKSVVNASLQSVGFDFAGLVSVLVAGFAYDRVAPARRRWLMAGSLAALALVLVGLPGAARAAPLAGAGLVGLAGLLVYGPYSLLAGTLAVESGGIRLAATAAGIIDGAGYIAGSLAGVTLGRLLDVGGYSLGFGVLAAITALSALIALALPRDRPGTPG